MLAESKGRLVFFRNQLESAAPDLRISPPAGVLPPESSVPVRVELSPRSEREFNFSFVCSVAQKFRPLRVDVKAEGYLLKPQLLLVEAGGWSAFGCFSFRLLAVRSASCVL